MESRYAGASARQGWVKSLVVLVTLEADGVEIRLLELSLNAACTVIELSFDPVCVDAARASGSSLLGLEVTCLVLAKLGANQRLLDLPSSKGPLPRVKLSHIESQSLLNSSKVI